MSALKSWGRLLRLSLAATAIADIVAGAIFASQGQWIRGPSIWILCLASLCVYHGGMALNDWADRNSDARVRPSRPIPSGSIGARAALGVALVLLLAGPAIAFAVDLCSGGALLVVALLAVVYDLSARDEWLGPALLAACRAGNLFAGMLLGSTARPEGALSPNLPLIALAAPVAYGAYVFCVGRIGRLEDAPAGTRLRPLPWIVGACAFLACAPQMPYRAFDRVPGGPTGFGEFDEWHGPDGVAWLRVASVCLVAIALIAPLRLAWKTRRWEPAQVLRTMGMLLRRLLVFTAALALSTESRTGLIACALILCGYPLSFALRKVFPPS